ncbi:kinesin family member C1 [Marchantia polymorpha subsp. ruderalis]
MKSASKLSKSAPGTPRKDLSSQKENYDDAPTDKKRKLGGRDLLDKRAMTELKPRVRQAFLSLNSRLDSSPSSQMRTPTNTTPRKGAAAREAELPVTVNPSDVDALLSMKMTGKNKFDYKGKCEQMMDYIKKLRACIRQFQELETNITLEKDDLRRQLDDEKESREQSEATLKYKQDELEAGLAELKGMCNNLEERLAYTESEKENLLKAREKDAETLQSAEKEISRLTEHLDKSNKEVANLLQQVSSLQDINKRLQEYNTSLQQYNSKLQSDATAAAEAMSRTQKEKAAIMETLSALRGHTSVLQDQLDASKTTMLERLKQNKELKEEAERIRSELQRITDDREQRASQIQALMDENMRYKECTGKSAAELEQLSNKAVALEEGYTSQAEAMKALRQQLDFAHQKLKMAEARIAENESKGDEYKGRLEEVQQRLSEAESRLHEGELVRRKLHNTILELKGNVRVFCRVRPLMPDEDDNGGTEPIVQYPNSTELMGRGIELVQSQGQKHTFTFDKVFGPEVMQEDVFVEISQLVQSALDGYKVCIFAYGQTGSGKTHTMLGNQDRPEQRGVIPRSLEQIFKTSQALSSTGWSFRMQASMLEIYNETIRDLLARPGNGNGNENGTPAKQHIVKHDLNGNTIVSDLTLVEVSNWKEVASLLQRAAQSRSVGKTAMNEQSSRSHCVFTLRISGVNESTEQQVHGVLNLIDLAGSERLSRSCSTGDRLKETQAINKSLSSLGDVILAIGNKEQHIPYRNSKLTYLLQPCLGGDSKTLMFVNISPDSKSLNESLCSLRFAAKVNACEIGVPRRQTLGSRNADSRLRKNGSYIEGSLPEGEYYEESEYEYRTQGSSIDLACKRMKDIRIGQ